MGSTPTSATYDTIPWSNGDDAWLTSRRGWFDSVRDHLVGSVGVSGAHRFGKAGGRVQFPDGPLDENEWACMPLEATDPCKVGEVGSTPIRSTERHGLLVQWDDAGSASRPRALGEPGGSTPRRSTEQYGRMVQRDDTSAACWRSEFDSRWVHWKRQRKVAGYGWPGLFAKAVL